MNTKNISSAALIISLIGIHSCRKAENPSGSSGTPEEVQKAIIYQLADNVIFATYQDMDSGAVALETHVNAFIQNGGEEELKACRESWLAIRGAWEKSEGFLFGPVATQNVDPRIDTWPVNFQSLDSVLTHNSTFDNAYIESLEDALRGFHPIEYLIFGQNGEKKAADFTQRQKDYLLALSHNLRGLCDLVVNEWHGGYYKEFTQPGSGSVYANQREVYEEIVQAIIGICDEVANGKILEPFSANDPSLEESPFSQNSMTDFTNNIRSVANIYYGAYSKNGKGLEDFVRLYNLSLHGKISMEIEAAIKSLENISLPFGQAITAEATKLQSAMDAINALKETLENELLPLVQLHSAE